MTSDKISVLLIVHNEEKRIDGCLKNIKDISDEIVVVHDGQCRDNTLKICSKFGCRIFKKPFVGEPKPQTPFGISKCKFNWVLMIDADEKLSQKLKDCIKELIQDKKIDAYRFNWIFKIRGIKSKFMTKSIIFRKSKMYSIGLPHTQCETKGKLKYINLDLLHDTTEFNSKYSLLKSYLKKDKSWGQISSRILTKPLNQIEVFNINLEKDDFNQKKKIWLMQRYPLFGLLILPPYSFIYSFILKKGYKQGLFGLTLSLHVPIYEFFTCWYLMKHKLGIK